MTKNLKATMLDLAERAGWTAFEGIAGSATTGTVAAQVHSFGLVAVAAGAGVAILICVLKVLGVQVSTVVALLSAAAQLPGAAGKVAGEVDQVVTTVAADLPMGATAATPAPPTS